MNSAAKTPKQTAGNNELLRNVKRIMNSKVYDQARLKMNAQGEEATIAYLQKYFNQPISAEWFASAKF